MPANFFLFALAAFKVVTSSPGIYFTNSGVDHEYFENQPNLTFGAVARVCTSGVWITYPNQNYALEEYDFITVHPYLQYFCSSLSSPKVGSARFVGLQSDYSAPSITMYTRDYFTGDRIFRQVGEEVVVLRNVNSIITIGAQVEFFHQSNFGGDSVCYEIPPQNCADKVCYNSMLNLDDFPWGDYPGSARAGCSPEAQFVKASAKNDSGKLRVGTEKLNVL